MKRESAGRYELTSTAGEEVRSFVPAPLPPEPPVLIEGTLQALHDRALLACGRLDGVLPTRVGRELIGAQVRHAEPQLPGWCVVRMVRLRRRR